MNVIKTKGPKLDLKHGKVDMTHGGGGRAMGQLISDLFIAEFDNEFLNRQNDNAEMTTPTGKLVMATDAHVIAPLFFPGGDIGSLSVHGTVNDVAMAGAKPLWIAASFILEEGFPLGDLAKIVRSMAAAAREAEVQVVTGDTKVVEKGHGDGVFITTTGVGVKITDQELSGDAVQPGDKVILSGAIGDHGVAIMSKRQGLAFETELQSDTASLHDLVAALCDTGAKLRVMRDPTRGGVSATLNEIAQSSSVGFHLDEAAIPVRAEVEGACELLGLDPLNVANEGKLIAICPAEAANELLAAMKAHELGRDAAIIGEAVEDAHSFVQMTTKFGGRRMVDWLSGEQLPRIC